ncbi:DUF992 domain-containing protein [Xanthobacteraceae bacterium A53D]
MRFVSAISAAAVVGAALSAMPAAAQPAAAKIQLGVLNCEVAPSVGFVIGSVRNLTCDFITGTPTNQKVIAQYTGTVSRFGIDIGISGGGVLSWGVFAPTTAPAAVDLAGKYIGASADVAWGLGGGANVLLGGSGQTVALQPLSVAGITGMQVAAGIADLTLVPTAPVVVPVKPVK